MENLKGGDTVVGIDYGDGTQLQKLLKGVLGVTAVLLIQHGISGHENLGRHLVVFREKLLVDHHKPGLADGRAGLL